MKKKYDVAVSVNAFGKIYQQEKHGEKEYMYYAGCADKIITDELEVAESVERVKLLIKYSVGASKIVEICDTVASSVFDDETGEYLPELVDSITSMQILEKYARFRISKGIDQYYKFIADTDMVAFVKARISKDELKSIYKGVEQRINYKKEVYTSKLKNETSEVINQCKELLNAYKHLEESVKSTLGNTDINELVSVVKQIVSEDSNKLIKIANKSNKIAKQVDSDK